MFLIVSVEGGIGNIVSYKFYLFIIYVYMFGIIFLCLVDVVLIVGKKIKYY